MVTHFANLSAALQDAVCGDSRALQQSVPRFVTFSPSAVSFAHDLMQVFQHEHSQRGGAPLRVVLCHDGVAKFMTGDRSDKAASGGVCSVTEFVAQTLVSLSPKMSLQIAKLCPEQGYPPSLELATEESCARLARALSLPGLAPDVVIACGSGSLTDVVKHAVFTIRSSSSSGGAGGPALCPAFWVVPTALTVTAFTSRFAVLGEEGHKVTKPSALADAVLFCGPIVSGAPKVLSAAGAGDLLAGAVSYADWYVASALGLASDYRPEPARLMMPFHNALFSEAQETAPDQHGHAFAQAETLAEALAAAGIAMNLGGSSAPQSGGEHAVSHVLDLLRHLSGRPRTAHGLQVALAAAATAAMHDWLDGVDFVPAGRVVRLEPAEVQELVERTFWLAPFSGSPAEFANVEQRKQWTEAKQAVLDSSCQRFVAAAQAKAEAWQQLYGRIGSLQEAWHEIQTERGRLAVPAARVSAALGRWGLPQCAEELDPPAHVAELRWAVRMSVFFRARFGIQDLVFFLGEDPVLAAAL